MSASRFLTGFSEGLAEARRGRASRGAVRHLAKEWWRHQDDHVTSLVSVHDMRLGLLGEAINNPDLAAALDVYGSAIPAAKRQLFLFVEAVYRTYLLEWRVGGMTLEELYGNLRIFFRNPSFREHWEATRPHRASLARDSAEACSGCVADELAVQSSFAQPLCHRHAEA